MIIHIPYDTDIPFFARIVRQGDRYGLKGQLTHHGKEPYIEFYDARFDHNQWLGEIGQFVSRYNLKDIMEFPDGVGLDLDGGIDDWKLTAAQVRYVKDRIAYLLNTDYPEHDD
jgi:hypothetical protein